jgi:hypothetical protein
MKEPRPAFSDANEAASQHAPTESSWGFFIYGDVSGGIGGGVGGFLWFPTRDGMLRFVGSYLTDFCCDEVMERSAVVSSAVKPYLEAESDLEVLRQELNAITKGHIQIAWWGDLNELAHSKDEFPREVRAHANGDENSDPIQSKDLPEFASAITDYGS